LDLAFRLIKRGSPEHCAQKRNPPGDAGGGTAHMALPRKRKERGKDPRGSTSELTFRGSLLFLSISSGI